MASPSQKRLQSIIEKKMAFRTFVKLTELLLKILSASVMPPRRREDVPAPPPAPPPPLAVDDPFM